MDWYLKVLREFYGRAFSGRARRREYWTFVAISFIIVFSLRAIDIVRLTLVFPSKLTLPIVFSITIIDIVAGFYMMSSGVILSRLYLLAVSVPTIAVSVRRLQDTGRSGWFLLLALIPCVGDIVLLVFMLGDSQPGDNEYGPNPKGVMV